MLRPNLGLISMDPRLKPCYILESKPDPHAPLLVFGNRSPNIHVPTKLSIVSNLTPEARSLLYIPSLA
jgi:hypothetical protein